MGIKDLKPILGKYQQGFYNPRNPEKYIGDLSKIIFRSSYELKFMKYCDNFSSILKWSSEPIVIPYFNVIDEKMHNYNVDFYIRYINDENIEKDYLIEIKPDFQKNKPNKPLKKDEYEYSLSLFESGKIKNKPIKESKSSIMKYNSELKTYIINQCKFNSAKNFAKERGYDFLILTESFLFNNKMKM